MYDRLEQNLNTIFSLSEMLVTQSELPNKEYRDDLQSVAANAHRLIKLIKTLLPLKNFKEFNNIWFMAANDMRSPLSSIIGFTRMMIEHPDVYQNNLSNKQLRQVKAILHCGQQTLFEIDKLVTYYGIPNIAQGWMGDYFSLTDIFGEHESRFGDLAHSIPIKLTIAPNLPSAFGSKQLASIAIWGLVLLLNNHSKDKITLSIDSTLNSNNERQIRIRLASAESDLTRDMISRLIERQYADETQIIEVFLAKTLTELQKGQFEFEVGSDLCLNFFLYLPVASLAV